MFVFAFLVVFGHVATWPKGGGHVHHLSGIWLGKPVEASDVFHVMCACPHPTQHIYYSSLFWKQAVAELVVCAQQENSPIPGICAPFIVIVL